MPPPRPTPRGSRPDAESATALYLIKPVTALRATYQVRLLALKAAESGKKLILQVPAGCRFDPALEGLIRETDGLIQREDLP